MESGYLTEHILNNASVLSKSDVTYVKNLRLWADLTDRLLHTRQNFEIVKISFWHPVFVYHMLNCPLTLTQILRLCHFVMSLNSLRVSPFVSD